MEPYPYLQENLRDPVKFAELLAPELCKHLPAWQVEVMRVMVERQVAFRVPLPPLDPRRAAWALWVQAKANPMVMQLLPAPLPQPPTRSPRTSGTS